VYCDNNPDQGPLHAPFRVDKTSDLMMLTGLTTNGSRTLVDWTAFASLETDQAWARLGAGGSWRKCSPTPYTGNLVEPWFARLETNGMFAFAFPTEPGRSYIVEHCTNLTGSNTWEFIGVYAGNGLEQVIRTPAAPKEFFRVRRE
jgi:hypothetical protein